MGKNHQLQLVTNFHSSKVSLIRSQPCQRLQNKLLAMTLLEYLITLSRVALLEDLKQFNRTVTLLKDLQLAVRPTQLKKEILRY